MATFHSIPQLAPGQVRKRNVFDILELLGGTNTTPSAAKNILIRVDFNVPMNSELKITDDSRIRGALPTIAAVLQAKHNCILMSHMGRPKAVQKSQDTDGSERAALSLENVVGRLSDLSGTQVQFVPDCIGPQVKDAVSKLPAAGGAILLLENLRFYKQEETNDPVFAQSLASIADAYVNDAFGTCHRAHASVSGVPALLPPQKCGVGCLVASEVAYLDFSSLGPDDKVAAGESMYIYCVTVYIFSPSVLVAYVSFQKHCISHYFYMSLLS
jgi:phosphoglycerate kinase